MEGTFTLGRLKGIRVGVHWSVLIIFAFVIFVLAEGRLPEAHPDRPTWLYWLVGLLAAVVFFASLLAHEIAHVLVARRNGVEADSITLWLLGGAARLRDEAPTPGAEVRIAGVGPLVSLVLGAGFVVVAVVLDALGVSGLTVEAVAWLAAINILLAVFNALPAAPLDGGRLLRAAVWARTKDRLRATAVATTTGRVFGWILVALGLWQTVALGDLGGLWLALVGWFLIAAATAEGSYAQLRGALNGVPVRQAMTPDPVTAPAATTVAELLEEPLFRYRHSAFPVVDDSGAPLGLVTLNQIKSVPPGQRPTRVLADAMLPLGQVATTDPDESLASLLPRLESSPARRALVLREGRLVGIVCPSDVSRVLSWVTSPEFSARTWRPGPRP